MIPVSRAEKADKPQSEWDYWLAMAVLTVLAFATRFYRIDYPNEVVFDEVHFGKVGTPAASRRPRHREQGNLLADFLDLVSSPRTIFSACTSSMFTPPSENCFSPLWAG